MDIEAEFDFEEALCSRCGEVARLTMAGWRHGWPPAGADGHCIGTAFRPTVK